MRTVLIASIAFAALLQACGGTAEPQPEGEILPGDPRFVRSEALNVENISRPGEKRSHNEGQNCMGCHQEHGPGKGLFTVAGTLYGADEKPLSGGTLELHSMPSFGEPILVVAVDALGNFFTTEEVPFPDSELFPLVKSADGALSNGMPFPTSSGACNICHNEQRRVFVSKEK